jgi:hypothetical protein
MSRIRARTLAALAILAGALTRVPAEGPPVLKVGDFRGEGITEGELDTLERMIASYIVETRLFRVVDSSGTDVALSELEAAFGMGADSAPMAILSPDYVLEGRIGPIGQLLALTLENIKVRTAEKRSVTETYPSVNDIVLGARALTLRLLDRPQATSASPAASTRPDPAAVPTSKTILSLSMLAGTWKGDRGIDKVRMSKDGSGVATLTTGITMKVRASISEGRFVILQDQSSSSLFYASPNYSAEVAKEIAHRAKPMRWVFALSEDGKVLTGIKETVAVTGTPPDRIEIDYDYVREASWTRVY